MMINNVKHVIVQNETEKWWFQRKIQILILPLESMNQSEFEICAYTEHQYYYYKIIITTTVQIDS